MRYFIKGIVIIISFFLFQNSYSWHDNTHIAIGKAAGFKKACYLAAPDIAKLKAGDVESFNHWYNNEVNDIINIETVKKQISNYNLSAKKESKGHLYGAIVASIRDFKRDSKKGKYGYFHIIYSAHYIGDLSMPFHNIQFKGYARSHHTENDGIIENEVLENIDKIKIYPIEIKTEEDLIQEISRIAQISKILGYILQKEERNMTQEEAYVQISHSVSLLKAVLEFLEIKD